MHKQTIHSLPNVCSSSSRMAAEVEVGLAGGACAGEDLTWEWSKFRSKREDTSVETQNSLKFVPTAQMN